jgi:hypothetical protein
VANFIDQLEALLREATPEKAQYWELEQTVRRLDGEPVCDTNCAGNYADEYGELIALLFGHSPALLEVVKAAQAFDEQFRAGTYDGWQCALTDLRQALRKLGVGE